jgi:hypothetical protein
MKYPKYPTETPEKPEKNVLPPVATFDFTLLNPAIHDWIQRRWQVLLTSINCTTAAGIGLFVGLYYLNIRDRSWIIIASVAIVLFAGHAWIGWRDAKAMLEFQSYGPFPPKDTPK